MNSHCNCHKKVTRNFAEAHNNKCPKCHKTLVSNVKFNNDPPSFVNSENELDPLYQNNNVKPDFLELDNSSFTDFISETKSHRKEPIYSNIKSENHLPTTSFSHELPRTSIDSPHTYVNHLNEPLYDEPTFFRKNTNHHTPPRHSPIQEITDDATTDSSDDNLTDNTDTDSDVSTDDKQNNDQPAFEANMEHFAQLYGLLPPRLESRKSDIRKFFSVLIIFCCNIQIGMMLKKLDTLPTL